MGKTGILVSKKLRQPSEDSPMQYKVFRVHEFTAAHVQVHWATETQLGLFGCGSCPELPVSKQLRTS